MKKWTSVAVTMLVAATASAGLPADEKSGMERTADALLIGLPAAAFGLTWLLDRADEDAGAAQLGFADTLTHMNGSPRHDLGLALLRAGVITYGLKATVDEERPNGESGSFPSGHTAATFAGAEFIRKNYGWQWAAPAYAAATYVGWSRVQTRDHWGHDVVIGAAIGILSNYDIGNLDTSWGRVSMQPALVSTPAFDPRLDLDANGAARSAPGFSFELRF